MSSFLGQSALSRGIRNNNPGNLKRTSIAWQGKIPFSQSTDGTMEQFTDIKYGIRAMLRDVVNDIDKGHNTIKKLITQYAPPFENNTISYINDVSKTLGIGANEPITIIDNKLLTLLAKAIIKKENGKDAKYVTNIHIQGAINILGTFSTKIKVNVTKSLIASLVLPIILFFYTVFMITL